MVWNIFHYNAACSDYYITPDRNAGHHMDACANPNIVAYCDRISIFQSLVSPDMVNGMACRIKSTARRNEHIVPKSDFCPIQYHKVMVGIEILPHLDIVTIVAPEWGCDC